jgi:hypothetical protein
MFKYSISFLMLILFLALAGCSEEASTKVSEESGSPEYAASKFFYSIYESKNVADTAQYTTPKLQRIIKSYGSTTAVARHLLNMQFDKVEIEIDRGRNLRESYGKKATISLIFRGMLRGNRVTDTRSVKMVKRKGKWLVKKIMYDPYAR